MRRKHFRLLAGALLFLGAVALGSLWFYQRSGQHRRGSAAQVANLPRETVLAVRMDLRRVREYPAVQQFRTWWASRAAARASTGALASGCGFDPFDRLDTLVWAVDGGVGQLGPLNGLLIGDGDLGPGESLRCITSWSAQHAQSPLVPAGTVDRHSVFTFGGVAPEQWLGPAGSQPELALLDRGALVTSSSFVTQALAAADGRAPRLRDNEVMQQALAAVGGDPLVVVVLDARAASLLSSGGHPGHAFEALAPGLVSGGLALASALSYSSGLTVNPSGGKLVHVIRFPGRDEAHAASTRLTELWAQWGGVLRDLVRTGEVAYLDQLRLAQQTNAALAGPIAAVQGGFAVFNRMLEQLRLREDGAAVRVEYDLSNDDLAAIGAGIKGAVECQELTAHGPTAGTLPPS